MRLTTPLARPCILMLLLAAVLTACASGPVRRVSEPMASVQQLTVQPNGQWSIELRVQNFSSIPMRFERIELDLQLGGSAAGKLLAQPLLDIGPESADVITVQLQPAAEARMQVADALASGRNIGYRLEGSTDAVPQNGRSRNFKLERSSSLNPVPGLVGVLR